MKRYQKPIAVDGCMASDYNHVLLNIRGLNILRDLWEEKHPPLNESIYLVYNATGACIGWMTDLYVKKYLYSYLPYHHSNLTKKIVKGSNFKQVCSKATGKIVLVFRSTILTEGSLLELNDKVELANYFLEHELNNITVDKAHEGRQYKISWTDKHNIAPHLIKVLDDKLDKVMKEFKQEAERSITNIIKEREVIKFAEQDIGVTIDI
jgi:hypothetical protein